MLIRYGVLRHLTNVYRLTSFFILVSSYLNLEAEDDAPPGCFYLFDQILVIPFPSQERIA